MGIHRGSDDAGMPLYHAVLGIELAKVEQKLGNSVADLKIVGIMPFGLPNAVLVLCMVLHQHLHVRCPGLLHRLPSPGTGTTAWLALSPSANVMSHRPPRVSLL